MTDAQSILGAFSKPSVSRTSAIPLNPGSQASQPSSSTYTQTPTPSTASSSHFPDQQSLDFSPDYSEMTSTRAVSYGAGGTVGSRSMSGGMAGSAATAGTGTGGMSNPGSATSGSAGGTSIGEKKVVIRRPEDVFRVTRDRLFSWSYMMQWYQG